MDCYTNNGHSPGLQRWFTDFDGWVTDFKNVCRQRYPAPMHNCNGNKLILQDALIDGFVFNDKHAFRRIDTHQHFLMEYNYNGRNKEESCLWQLGKMKESREWYVEAPWGKIAVTSYGESLPSKVLLIHGRQDSSATFLPLLQLLPERHYVALDLPGHGLSDPLPVGLTISRIHFAGALEFVIKHVKWDKFTVIAHSMGGELALIYNIAYPGRIKKLILLDAGPALQRLQICDPVEYYQSFYENYFNNYKKYNNDQRIYSKKRAMDAVMRARGLSEERAEVVLSRNLREVGEDQYKLSWDRRLAAAAPLNYPIDYYYQIFSQNTPPTLLLQATQNSGYEKGKKLVEYLLSQMKLAVDLQIVPVEGNHDVHLIHPERVAPYIIEFMKESNSKL